MAQHILDDTQVGTAIEHMGSTRMAEHVRMQVGNTAFQTPLLDHPEYALAGYAPSPGIQEDRTGRYPRLHRECRTPLTYICGKSTMRLAGNGHDPFLGTLAHDQDETLFQIHPVAIQTAELAHA